MLDISSSGDAPVNNYGRMHDDLSFDKPSGLTMAPERRHFQLIVEAGLWVSVGPHGVRMGRALLAATQPEKKSYGHTSCCNTMRENLDEARPPAARDWPRQARHSWPKRRQCLPRHGQRPAAAVVPGRNRETGQAH